MSKATPDSPMWAPGVAGSSLALVYPADGVVNSDANALPLGESDAWTMNVYVKAHERLREWTRIAGFGDPGRREPSSRP